MSDELVTRRVTRSLTKNLSDMAGVKKQRAELRAEEQRKEEEIKKEQKKETKTRQKIATSKDKDSDSGEEDEILDVIILKKITKNDVKQLKKKSGTDITVLEKALLDLQGVEKGGEYAFVLWKDIDATWIPIDSVPESLLEKYKEKSYNKQAEIALPPVAPTSDINVPLVTDTDIRLLGDAGAENFRMLLDQKVEEKKDDEGNTFLETTVGTIQSITPAFVLKQLSDDAFVRRIIENLHLLYAKKLEKYNAIYFKTNVPENKEEFSIKPLLLEMANIADEKYRNRQDLETVRKRLIDAIMDRKNGILSLSGDARREMRNFLANQIYVLSRSMAPFNESFLNIALSGPAGTGKSKMASVMAFVYGKIGVLLKDYPNNIIVGSAKDVVSSFQGETASKTNAFLGRGLESVIFIDEAYGIMSCTSQQELASQQGYGPDAITEIVNFLDVYRGLSILVVAGYEKSMNNCFFAANQGLSRRFPFKYALAPYTSDDLTAQFINVVNERFGKEMFNRDVMSLVKIMIDNLNSEGKFPNQAGDVANLSSIFATAIESYPGYTWSENPSGVDEMRVNIFMLSQVYNIYNKSKQPLKPSENVGQIRKGPERSFRISQDADDALMDVLVGQ